MAVGTGGSRSHDVSRDSDPLPQARERGEAAPHGVALGLVGAEALLKQPVTLLWGEAWDCACVRIRGSGLGTTGTDG